MVHDGALVVCPQEHEVAVQLKELVGAEPVDLAVRLAGAVADDASQVAFGREHAAHRGRQSTPEPLDALGCIGLVKLLREAPMSRVLVLLISLVGLCIVAPAALGKGASEATITGPGLGEPITLSGEGQAGGEQLMQLAEDSGFFPAVFSREPDPILDARPEGTLGPKYLVEYVMPGPNNEVDTLVQELYPYAAPSPVTFVEPGQPFWTTEATRGGWFVASAALKDQLVAAGLPETAPTGDAAASDSPWTVLGPGLVLVVIAALGGIAVLVTRRRPRAA